MPTIDKVTLERLHTTHSDLDDRLRASPTLLSTISTVTRSSRLLTHLLAVDPLALDVIEALDNRAPLMLNNVSDLVAWKQRELLRIAARDLTGLDELEATGAHLAELAEDVLSGAVELCGAGDRLVIVGMGKLGGRELNYASDVDVMFVGDCDDRVARLVMEIARQCFRIDATLRPEGRDGPLVRSLESYERYWDQWANTWEFQALLKARTVAGPSELAQRWNEKATSVLWSHSFGADELRELRDLKARVERIVEGKGLRDREVKRGRGGIRDVEFSVQLLQLVHGKHDDSIRSATTLTALHQLADGGYIAAQDNAALSASYRFLRAVEHRLQLVDGEQTHTVPTDRESRRALSRSLGYRDTPQLSALDEFEHDLRTHQAMVRQTHERLYFRPLLEAFAAGTAGISGPVGERLAAFGFTDAARTRHAVNELTHGLARSSRLMQQLMPLLLEWLSDAPDPDEGLLGLRSLIAGFRTPAHMVAIFRDSPEVARRLCLLLGTSRLFTQGFNRHPELLDDLAETELLANTTPVIDRLRHALGWRLTGAARWDALRRLKRAEQLRIAASDVLGFLTETEANQRRCELAEAVLDLTLEELHSNVPIALIGVGRFGGHELSYASDLDTIVVHGGRGSDDQAVAERVAQQLLELIGDPSPARQLYPLDYDLRPEGKKGLLARSVEGCREYYTQWAETWERQAMLRSRPVGGDSAVATEFMDVMSEFIWDPPLQSGDLRKIRLLKARMERERVPRGEDPQFHLKLGRGSLSDIEWTVQLLQLQHRVENTNTLAALKTLEQQGHIDPVDAQILRVAWVFCDRVRNRWFLVNGGPSDSLPVDTKSLAALARSLQLAPVELREQYRQVTRRARRVVERLFYEKEEEV